eukprot:3490698-Rhodomonas_salina.1
MGILKADTKPVKPRGREGEGETERQGDRERGGDRERERASERASERARGKEGETERGGTTRQRQTHTHTQTRTETDTQRDRHTERQTHRETDTHRDRHTQRQTRSDLLCGHPSVSQPPHTLSQRDPDHKRKNNQIVGQENKLKKKKAQIRLKTRGNPRESMLSLMRGQ